jgi:hypothetical protein
MDERPRYIISVAAELVGMHLPGEHPRGQFS